jgi:hypothetical protein
MTPIAQMNAKAFEPQMEEMDGMHGIHGMNAECIKTADERW